MRWKNTCHGNLRWPSFQSNSIPPKIIIDFTLDRYKVFRRIICTEPGSEQVGSVLVLGAEVVQVGPIQMFGPKQNYSSKHLDRTSTGPGSEQLRRLNSLFEKVIFIVHIHTEPLFGFCQFTY